VLRTVTKEVVEAAQAILRSQGPSMMQYGPALGFQPLREWLAQWQGVKVEQIGAIHEGVVAAGPVGPRF